MRRFSTLVVGVAALALSACATTPMAPEVMSGAPQEAVPPASAQAALSPYYDGIPKSSLPVAPANASLSEGTTLTRIAFGSCVNENKSQAFWNTIAATNPQLFLLIGDNVYGDTGATWAADMPSLIASYAKLASAGEFAAFRAAVPMMTTWDDHDYGANDAGGSFAFKGWAETVYENFWQSPADVAGRPGVYQSRTYGPQGKRVQVITLDTRYFRSDLARFPFSEERRPLGNYGQNTDAGATMLGAAQWAWLEAELAKPADVRIIASSVQVLTEAHDFESWENFPNERARFLNELEAAGGANTILLTGDRHQGGLYRMKTSIGDEMWEITSSSLNFSFGSGENGAREPDPYRVGGLWSDTNFGELLIDWDRGTVDLVLKRTDGQVLERATVAAMER